MQAFADPLPAALSATAPGIFSYFGYHLPFEARIGLIAAAGFTATALWYGPEEGHVRHGNPTFLWRACREQGLAIDYVHASYRGCNAIWSTDPAERQELLDRYRRAADFCREAGAGVLVIHVVSGDAPPPPGAAGLDFMQALLESVQAGGPRLAIENTRSPEHVDFLLDNLEHPGLGLCYDSSHDLLFGRPALAILRRRTGRIFSVHLSDNDGRYDRHWLPGTGTGDLPAALAALREAGFAGRLTLEVFPRDRKLPPGEFLKLAREWKPSASYEQPLRVQTA